MLSAGWDNKYQLWNVRLQIFHKWRCMWWVSIISLTTYWHIVYFTSSLFFQYHHQWFLLSLLILFHPFLPPLSLFLFLLILFLHFFLLLSMYSSLNVHEGTSLWSCNDVHQTRTDMESLDSSGSGSQGERVCYYCYNSAYFDFDLNSFTKLQNYLNIFPTTHKDEVFHYLLLTGE